MTREGEIVRLAPGNWIALFSLVLALVTALVTGAARMADVSAELRAEVRHLSLTVSELKLRLERLEARSFPFSKDP